VFDPQALHHPWFAVEFLLGLVLVAVLAGEWFNRPGSIRSQTTAAKYHAGLLIYRFGLALVYCSAALAAAPHVPPTVVVVAIVALRKAPLVWHFDVWAARACIGWSACAARRPASSTRSFAPSFTPPRPSAR
jgi:hypothetical protein